MTVLSATRLALASLLDSALDVDVVAFPPGETQAGRECVYLDGSECRFEWRSLGNASKNRTEDISIEIVVSVYREAPSYPTAAAAALARCESLLASIETAVVTDAAGPFTVGGNVKAGARIGEWSVRSYQRESGCSAEARARLVGTNIPA